MSTFHQRLIQEETELNEKIEKLEVFILSEAFAKIEPEQSRLLLIQIEAMRTYSKVLQMRLNLLPQVG
jgi:hypothetical protein